MKFSKPYPKDYRQSSYYKQSFNLKIYHIFKKYDLKYVLETGNIINIDTGEPFLIFSFDEASFQFTPNNVKLWSLIKPLVEKDSTQYVCKAMGSYSLTPEGNDYIEFIPNKKGETVIKYFENLREKNPKGVILLLIDNFSSHKTDEVLAKAKELNIVLCFLPPYSPQLQPEEKVWRDNKRDIGEYKVTSVKNYRSLKKKDRQKILERVVKNSFDKRVKSKKKWNDVFNTYMLPKIIKNNPLANKDVRIPVLLI